MLKRKIFAVALPIIAGATIVGSGFAAWVFNTQTESVSTQIGVELTEQTSLENLTIKYSYDVSSLTNEAQPTTLEHSKDISIKLVLDQGRSDFTGAEVEKGIWFKINDGQTDYQLKNINIEVVNTEKALETLTSAGYAVKFDTKLTIDPNLSKVVSLKESSTWSDNLFTGTGAVLEAKDKDVKAEQNKVLIDTKEKIVFNFASIKEEGTQGLFFKENTVFNYHSATGDTTLRKPQSSEEYSAFKTAVEACTTGIKLESSLTLVEANA